MNRKKRKANYILWRNRVAQGRCYMSIKVSEEAIKQEGFIKQMMPTNIVSVKNPGGYTKKLPVELIDVAIGTVLDDRILGIVTVVHTLRRRYA